jgi:hypothetical protein
MTRSLISALGLAYIIGYFVWAWSYDAEHPWAFDKVGVILYAVLPTAVVVFALLAVIYKQLNR